MGKESRIERRVFLDSDFELRKSEDGPTVFVGIASPFGKESEDMGFREVVKRGAFKNALTRSDTVALFNHDPNFVLGRESSETLRLKEGRAGLKAEIDFPDTQLIRDLVVGPVERRDIRGMSIGFIVAEGGDEIKKRQDGTILRTIVEIEELIDVSVVTFPAYQDTNVAVRSIDAWRKENETSDSNEAEEDGEKDSPKTEPEIHVAEARKRSLQLKKKSMEV